MTPPLLHVQQLPAEDLAACYQDLVRRLEADDGVLLAELPMGMLQEVEAELGRLCERLDRQRQTGGWLAVQVYELRCRLLLKRRKLRDLGPSLVRLLDLLDAQLPLLPAAGEPDGEPDDEYELVGLTPPLTPELTPRDGFVLIEDSDKRSRLATSPTTACTHDAEQHEVEPLDLGAGDPRRIFEEFSLYAELLTAHGHPCPHLANRQSVDEDRQAYGRGVAAAFGRDWPRYLALRAAGPDDCPTLLAALDFRALHALCLQTTGTLELTEVTRVLGIEDRALCATFGPRLVFAGGITHLDAKLTAENLAW